MLVQQSITSCAVCKNLIDFEEQPNREACGHFIHVSCAEEKNGSCQPCDELRKSKIDPSCVNAIVTDILSYARFPATICENCTICEGRICLCSDEQCLRYTVITQCNHLFHRTCLSQWFNEKKECPSCRNASDKTMTTPYTIVNLHKSHSEQMEALRKKDSLIRDLLKSLQEASKASQVLSNEVKCKVEVLDEMNQKMTEMNSQESYIGRIHSRLSAIEEQIKKIPEKGNSRSKIKGKHLISDLTDSEYKKFITSLCIKDNAVKLLTALHQTCRFPYEKNQLLKENIDALKNAEEINEEKVRTAFSIIYSSEEFTREDIKSICSGLDLICTKYYL
ncbi:MAG: hypothetical protein KDK72_09910 [Chlamydiia bacterium]|nr:hypothetical protein [Chlamydiia bacterium]